MYAFYFGDIEESGGIADEESSRKGEFGNGLESAFTDGASPVADSSSSFEHGEDGGVVFETLKFFVRGEVGIFVVEADNESDGHFLLIEVVQEGTAVSGLVERPPNGVNNFAGGGDILVDFPEFFDSEAVGLVLSIFSEIELAHNFLGERTAAPFCDEGLSCEYGDSGLERCPLVAVFLSSHIAGDDAFYALILRVWYDVDGGESGKDVDSHAFSNAGKPSTHPTKGDDEVAVVVHLRGRGEFDVVFFCEEPEEVFCSGGIKRRIAIFPIWQEDVETFGFEDGSREGVSSDFGSFFQDAYGDVFASF